jgi:hypothetical protein
VKDEQEAAKAEGDRRNKMAAGLLECMVAVLVLGNTDEETPWDERARYTSRTMNDAVQELRYAMSFAD